MIELRKALENAARELEHEHSWSISDAFYEVLTRHLEPLLNDKNYCELMIAQAKQQIEYFEKLREKS